LLAAVLFYIISVWLRKRIAFVWRGNDAGKASTSYPAKV